MTRLCTDICKSCKRTAPCTQITGIGELCRACQPEYQDISDLIDVLDGMHRSQADRQAWLSGIRCLQRLDINYQIKDGRLNIGASLGRLTTLRQAATIEREAIHEVLRYHALKEQEARRTSARRVPAPNSASGLHAT